jgi:hypothetical protein
MEATMPKVNDMEDHAAPKNNKRRRFIAIGLVGMVAMAGAAYAYFTTTGAGTGNAQVGTSTALTITAAITPAAGGIVPGGTGSDVAYSVNNPSSGHQLVNTVHFTGVAAYTDALHTIPIASGTGAAQCDVSQFSIADVIQNQDVPTGITALDDHGSLLMANAAFNQDGCKNAYLVASFTSN